MKGRAFSRWLQVALLAALPGCSASPAPETAAVPPAGDAGSRGGQGFVVGASDSVESIPGSPDAPYILRFRQVDPPSDRFTFQDRDLSFYFKPGPDALFFQVENRQNRPVSVEWERSVFFDPNGRSDKVAHGSTRWADRFATQSSTQIPGLQHYGDYLLPMAYLLDTAGGGGQQLHRPLIPEDSTSPQYTDRTFGVDLVITVEDRPRTYSFRFKVASVIPR